jgi:LAS superfamily LD-carboxypeptidase LdcB
VRGTWPPPPGTSNHGWGLSVDINVAADARAGRWLHANTARYGFFNDVPTEPWHWTYRPA